MANCPKCNAHLKLTDWKQYCPHCGANIFVYDLQERLMKQADSAEVEYYHFQKKIDRVKASFVGSKLAIARIFTSILPIAALFLPIADTMAGGMFEMFYGKVSLLTFINNIDSLNISSVTYLIRQNGALVVASVGCLLLSLVATLLHFILNTLSCSPKGKQRNIIMDVLIAVFTVAGAVCFVITPRGSLVYGTLGIGTYLYILLQAANIVVDILTLKQGIEVHHKQCYVGAIPIEEYFKMVESGMPLEEIRAEQYKRLQAEQDEKERKLREEEAKKGAEKTEKEGE